MLVISRRINEAIVIDDFTTITILDIKKGKVRVGIEAPITVEILRKEFYEKLQDKIIQQQEEYFNHHEPEKIAEHIPHKVMEKEKAEF